MEQHGDKTEQATPRKLEEAWKKGQFARSAEVQTVFVLFGGMLALLFAGHETWRLLGQAMTGTLGHLHDLPVKVDGMQKFFIDLFLILGACVWPVLAATAVGGLLAGGMQSRFRTASEVLAVKWERVNPLDGWKRVFSWRAALPTVLAFFKFAVVVTLAWNVIADILVDPIFYTSVEVARLAQFLADASFRIVMRVGFALMVLAAIDYGYQLWRTSEDLKMTKEEVKEESKNQEGDPQDEGPPAQPPPWSEPPQNARRSPQGRCHHHQSHAPLHCLALRPLEASMIKAIFFKSYYCLR